MSQKTHQPVLLKEAIQALEIKPKHWYLDATFGRGGHTQAILDQNAQVIAFDFDQKAIEFGQQEFKKEIKQGNLILIRENFVSLEKEVNKLQKKIPEIKISGILFDLGTSAEQLTSAERGLSFQGQTNELDMRLDQRLGVQAKDLLAVLGQKQLAMMFREYGGEEEANSIAKAIVRQRKQGNFIKTVEELIKLIETYKKRYSRHLHPATKVFQALRIAVNDELNNLQHMKLPSKPRICFGFLRLNKNN